MHKLKTIFFILTALFTVCVTSACAGLQSINPGAIWPDDCGEQYATAKDLKGPWSEFKDIALPETKTYNSQTTLLLKVVGTDKTSFIFMGDQWKPKAQWDSRYLWMPLKIGGGRLWLPEPREWTLDVKSGVATIKP